MNTIADLARKHGPIPNGGTITDAFGDLDKVSDSIRRPHAHRMPRTLDFDAALMHQWLYGYLGWRMDAPPPSTCVNLDVSADLPTLDSIRSAP